VRCDPFAPIESWPAPHAAVGITRADVVIARKLSDAVLAAYT
jgi:hypothetical protein